MKVENMTPEQQAEQRRLDEKGREVARMLDRAINPKMRHARDFDNRTTGFAILLFAFGEAPQPATYLSNGSRDEMIAVVEEWLNRMRARQ